MPLESIRFVILFGVVLMVGDLAVADSLTRDQAIAQINSLVGMADHHVGALQDLARVASGAKGDHGALVKCGIAIAWHESNTFSILNLAKWIAPLQTDVPNFNEVLAITMLNLTDSEPLFDQITR